MSLIVAVPFVLRIRGFRAQNLQKKVTLCLLTIFKKSGICFKNQDRTKPHSVTNRTLKAGQHVPEDSDLKCGLGGEWACKIHRTKHVVVLCFRYRENTRYDHLGDTSLHEKRAAGRYSLNDRDYFKDAGLCGTDHLGDTNMEETTWEIPVDMEQTILEMQVYMKTTWERQTYTQK